MNIKFQIILFVFLTLVGILLFLLLVYKKRTNELKKKSEELEEFLSMFGLIIDTQEFGVAIWQSDVLAYINSRILEHAAMVNVDLKNKEELEDLISHPEKCLILYDVLKAIHENRNAEDDYFNSWRKEIGKKYLQITYVKKKIGGKIYQMVLTRDVSLELSSVEKIILNQLIEILSDELSKEEISIYNLGDKIRELLTHYGLVDTLGIAFLQSSGHIYYPYMKYVDNDDRSGMRLGPEVKNLSRYVIDKGIKIHIKNSSEEEQLPDGYTLLKVRGEVFTIYAAPIVYRSVTRGVVLFEKQGIDQFSDSTILLFDKIVDVINLSLYFVDILQEIENDRKKLFELSIKDYLTGAYSRRFLEQFLEKELFKSKRMDTPLSVILMDIDKFKEINDTLGHVYGDNVLKTLVKIVNETIRSMDVIARYGGDEFVIVLPETNTENAQKVVERILKVLEKENIKVSYGIIDASSFDSIEEIYREVDTRMYNMKKKS